MPSVNILVVRLNNHLHPSLQRLSTEYSVKVLPTSTAGQKVNLCENGNFKLAVVDASDESAWEGLNIAKEFRGVYDKTPIILLTSESSEEFAHAALKAGINDYVKEPFEFEELSHSINRCLDQYSDVDPVNESLPPSADSIAETLIGESQTIIELRTYISKISATDSNVLITGETGTGKELIARLVHENSDRRKHAFICVNCAAIPETLLESELFGHERGAYTGAVGTRRGKMELAQGGTILFDEIGDMGHLAQAKILRAIEEKKIYRLGGKGGVDLNIRVIAATNQDLEASMMQGHFRNDLFYRLNVARIHLPPLRERKEDIPILLHLYIQEFNQRFNRQVYGFTDEALEFLLYYSWPGNIRELKNLLEGTFINLPPHHISMMDLPPQFQAKAKECEQLPQTERDRILSALLVTNWNRNKAAQKLQCSRMTLYRKMRKHNLFFRERAKSNEEKLLSDKLTNDVTFLPACASNM